MEKALDELFYTTDSVQYTDHVIVPYQVVILREMIAMIREFRYVLQMEAACVLIPFWEMQGVLGKEAPVVDVAFGSRTLSGYILTISRKCSIS